MIVLATAAWSCPDSHLSTTSVTAVAALTWAGVTVTAQVRVRPTRCRDCKAVLPKGPVLTVTDDVRVEIAAWARRMGRPIADGWVVTL